MWFMMEASRGCIMVINIIWEVEAGANRMTLSSYAIEAAAEVIIEEAANITTIPSRWTHYITLTLFCFLSPYIEKV